MQPGIRIVKRGTQNRVNIVSDPILKSDRQRERENVDTVKEWVSEWKTRKRQLQSAADTFIAHWVLAAPQPRNGGGSELKTLMRRAEAL
jgi:hypothetical protein